MAETPGYQILETEPGTFIVNDCMGSPVLTLTGGNAQVIVMTFLNMQSTNPVRANDYMAGVCAGIVHMAFIQESPQ